MIPNERTKHDFKQSYKILITDSSSKLEQIIKLIHIDMRFNNVLNVVKLSRVPIFLAGLIGIKLERNTQYILTLLKPGLMTLTF